MDAIQNANVIRIPVTDPSCGKSGLLHVSLPRECIACEEGVDFYATSDASAFGAVDSPASPSPSLRAAVDAAPSAEIACPRTSTDTDSGTTLDLALEHLRSARQGLADAQSDVEYADFTVNRARSDVHRLEGPLAQAEADTPSRNVRGAGEQLDFQLWSARNGLHDCEIGAARTVGDGRGITRNLESAAVCLQDLRTCLPSENGVLAVLDDAREALTEALQRSSQIDGALTPSLSELRLAETCLSLTDASVAVIKSDRTGVDVSGSAREIRDAVRQVHASLSSVQQALAAVEASVGPADTSADRAEAALEELRERLSHA